MITRTGEDFHPRSALQPNTISRLTQRFATSVNVVALLAALLALAMLLALPDPWNLRLPLYLTTLVWSAIRPRITLYLMPFAVAWGSLDYLALSSLRLDSADILVGFLLAGWLLSYALPPYLRASQGRTHERIPTYLTLAILALLGMMFLSMVTAINRSDSLKEISKWLEFLILVFIGSQYLQTRRQIWTMVVLICLTGLTQAAYGYAQAAFSIGPQSFIRDASLRVFGTFDQPNPYAGFINMPLSITLALTLLGRGWATRTLAGIATILLAIALYLTQSRGGEIAIVAVAAFIILAGMPKIRMLMRVLIIAVFATVEAFLAGLLPSSITDRLLRFLGLVQISLTTPTAQDFSTAERLAHWIAGIHMFLDHPLLGVGIGNYPDAYPQYFITIFKDPLGHAHNYYINIAAETGTIGLIVYVLFLAALFIASGTAIRHIAAKRTRAFARLQGPRPTILAPAGTRKRLALLLNPFHWLQYHRLPEPFDTAGKLVNDRALALGLMAALLSVCVHNLVDNLYVHSMTNLIALLLVAVIRLERVTPNFGYSGMVMEDDFADTKAR